MVLPRISCRRVGEPETLRVEGLDAQTRYYFAVRAIDAARNTGPLSTSLEVRTTIGPDVTPPVPITNLQVVDKSETSVTLRSTAPIDDRGTCASYDLRWTLETINEDNWAFANSVPELPEPREQNVIENHRVTGLPPGSRISFALRSRDAAGNVSGISNLVWAQTDAEAGPDSTPPSAVTDLIAAAMGATSVRLTWTAVGDDGLVGRASAYEVRRASAPINDASWLAATPVTVGIEPAVSRAVETLIVGGLTADRRTTTSPYGFWTMQETPRLFP